MEVESGPFPPTCGKKWRVKVVYVAYDVAKNGSGRGGPIPHSLSVPLHVLTKMPLGK